MKNKDNTIIDELLKDYSAQKKAHEDNFGEIDKEPLPLDALPKIENRNQQSTQAEKPKNKPFALKIKKAEKNPKKEKVKKEKTPADKAKQKAVLKKLLLVIIIIAVITGLVFSGIGIAKFAQSAYLRPYKQKYPEVEFPVGIEERFCDYYGENPTTAGYIEIEDCNIKEYILSENNDKNPMLDSVNNQKELDFNTVVYLNGSNSLEKTYSTSKNYLASTQKINFSTLFEDYTFNVIGAYYTNSKPEDDMGYVFPYNLTKNMTEQSLYSFTDRLYHRFLYNSDYYLQNNIITKNSKLITICTKTDFMPDFYFVVVGMLDASKVETATDNQKVHYPQIWYDKNKKENVYRFASKWYPEIIINGEETSQQSANDFTKF